MRLSAPAAGITPWTLQPAVRAIQAGGVIAYPTEGVFGLGCDPKHASAVARILAIKQRPVSKGLILIAASQQQLRPYLAPLNVAQQTLLDQSWPGPVTWIVPAGPRCPAWVRGAHPTVAVRVSAHPIVADLCRRLNHPLISTSANRAGRPPYRHARAARHRLGRQVDAIVNAPVGDLAGPTPIIDLATTAVLRHST